jgi:Bardet-Biedl syndrome 1 protein
MLAAALPSSVSDEGPWLHAWADPVAGVKTFTACVRLVDLAGDGDYRLVIADQEKRIKVYKGTSVASVHPLLDVPVALAAFYPADTAAAPGPRVPSIAVAAGSFVFVYRNLRPYMKFTLPQVPVAAQENTLWEDYWSNRLPLNGLIDGLKALRDAHGIQLTSRAGDVLALGDDKEVAAYLSGVRGRPLVQQTVVTCMDVINRDREGEKEVRWIWYIGSSR